MNTCTSCGTLHPEHASDCLLDKMARTIHTVWCRLLPPQPCDQCLKAADALLPLLAEQQHRNTTLQAALERMETEHVTFIGHDGTEIHPDWCRQCHVDQLQDAHRADVAELRQGIAVAVHLFRTLLQCVLGGEPIDRTVVAITAWRAKWAPTTSADSDAATISTEWAVRWSEAEGHTETRLRDSEGDAVDFADFITEEARASAEVMCRTVVRTPWAVRTEPEPAGDA